MRHTEVFYELHATSLFREYLLLFNLGVDDERIEKRMKEIDEDLYRINYAIKEREDKAEYDVDEETGREILLVPAVLIRLDHPHIVVEDGILVHYEIRQEEPSPQEDGGSIISSEALLSPEENLRFWRESGLEDLFRQ